MRVVGVALVIVCVATAARAESEPRYGLVYERPAGCPSAAALRAQVALELGYDPFTDEAAVTSIVVTIHGNGHGVRGRIEMREIDGVSLGARELSAPRCAELAPALALAIAVAIDPVHAGAPRTAGATPAPSPSPRALPKTAQTGDDERPGRAPAVARPQPAASAGSRFLQSLRMRMAVGIGGSFDSAPGPAFGFMARVGGATPRWSLALELRGDLPGSREAYGGHANASLMAAFGVACVHHRSLAFCALGGAGAQEVSGSGYLSARSFWVAWGALGARVELSLPVSEQLAVVARVDLLAPLTRTRLVVGSERPLEVYRTAPLSSTLGIGLSTR